MFNGCLMAHLHTCLFVESVESVDCSLNKNPWKTVHQWARPGSEVHHGYSLHNWRDTRECQLIFKCNYNLFPIFCINLYQSSIPIWKTHPSCHCCPVSRDGPSTTTHVIWTPWNPLLCRILRNGNSVQVEGNHETSWDTIYNIYI